MLVQATRTVSTFTLRALFYVGLFIVVVVAQQSLTGALRAQGWSNGASLLAAGAAVLALVVLLMNAAEWARDWRAENREMQRTKLKLPVGPCCVVWRQTEAAAENEDAMPWEIVGPMRARYPKLPRRLGVEGVAVAEFEVSATGAAKNVHCVYAWPSDVFYEAAREALAAARFQPKPDTHVRYGASYRIPFVFRIAGAVKLEDHGRRARPLRPSVRFALQAVEKLRNGLRRAA